MITKATFYHAGCPVCIDAERQFADSFDNSKLDVEIVHLGETPGRIVEAEIGGIESVPAFLIDGQAFHINFGASLEDLK